MTMYVDNVPVIVVADSRQALVDEARSYGLTGFESKFVLYTEIADTLDMNLSLDTQWCVVGNPYPALVRAVQAWYGEPVPFASALNMRTEEYVLKSNTRPY